MTRQIVETRYVAISRVRTWVVFTVAVVDSVPPGLPNAEPSASNMIPEPIDLATSLPTRPLVEDRIAKLVKWLHSQSVCVVFVSMTLQPLLIHASFS